MAQEALLNDVLYCHQGRREEDDSLMPILYATPLRAEFAQYAQPPMLSAPGASI